MILRIIAFTPRGTLLARELAAGLEKAGHRCPLLSPLPR